MKSFFKLKLEFLLSTVLIGLLVITGCENEDPLSDLTGFTSFEMTNDTIKDYPFDIDNVSFLIENTDSLPYQYNPVNLIAQFSVIEGSSVTVDGVEQVSGVTANDFTEPVTYIVTAEDGVTTKQYTVQVNVAQLNPEGLQWVQKNPNAFDDSFETQEYFFLNGKHWVVAGKEFTPGTTTAEAKLYSSEDASTWTEVTPSGDFPTGFQHNIIVYDNKAYVMGYITSAVSYGSEMLCVSKDFYYTEDGSTWSKIETSNEGRILDPLFNYNDKVYGFGGNKVIYGKIEQAQRTGYPYKTRPANLNTLIYDGTDFTVSDNNTFETSSTDVLKTRTLASGYIYEDKMYVLGGLNVFGGPLSEVISSSDGVTWTEVSTGAFSARIKASTVVYDDKVWLFGGQLEDGTCTKEILVSEDGGATWTEVIDDQLLPESFTPRCSADVTVDEDGNIWIIGGFSTTATVTDGVVSAEYTVLTDVWHGKLNKLD